MNFLQWHIGGSGSDDDHCWSAGVYNEEEEDNNYSCQSRCVIPIGVSSLVGDGHGTHRNTNAVKNTNANLMLLEDWQSGFVVPSCCNLRYTI